MKIDRPRLFFTRRKEKGENRVAEKPIFSPSNAEKTRNGENSVKMMDLKPLDLSEIATVEELQRRREDITNKVLMNRLRSATCVENLSQRSVLI